MKLLLPKLGDHIMCHRSQTLHQIVTIGKAYEP